MTALTANLVLWIVLLCAPVASEWKLRYIDLRVAIDPAAQLVTGVSRLMFTPTGTESADIVADASDSLTVDSAFVVGPAGLRIVGVREPGRVRFPFTVPLRAGASYEADVWYHGHPIRRAVGFVVHAGTPRAASFGIPRSAREWWPSADSPDQKADSADIRISAPAALIVASNGRLVDRTPSSDGATATAHWSVRYPIYSDAVSFSLAFSCCRWPLSLSWCQGFSYTDRNRQM